MKKTLICLCLLLVMLVGSAQASDVTFEGPTKDFVFTGANQMTTTDLFANFKNVLPGDTLTQRITVTNKSWDHVRIYLSAWAEGEPYDTEYDAELAGLSLAHEKNVEFLEQLNLQVELVKSVGVSSGVELANAPADEPDGLERTAKDKYGVLLGTYARNASATLDVTLTVPASMTSDYMGRVGMVPWTFTVIEIPDDGTPDTGDWFSLPVWIGLGVVLAAALVWLIFGAKKRKKA